MSRPDVSGEGLEQVAHHPDRNRAVSLDQIIKVALVEDEKGRLLISTSAGRAGQIVDKSQFAEVASGSERCDPFFAPMADVNDRHPAIEHDEQRFPRLPFEEDRLAGFILFLEQLYQQLAELPPAQTGKERDLLQKMEAAELFTICCPVSPVE